VNKVILKIILSLLLNTVLFGSGFSQAHNVIEYNGHKCVPNRLLVKFKKQSLGDNVRDRTRDRIRLVTNCNVSLKKRWQTGIELWELSANRLEAVINELVNDPDIEFAEPDFIYGINVIPNDTYFEQQWALNNTGQTGGLNDADIDAVEAWDISTGSKDVIVGIIDSGIDYLHDDLKTNVFQNPNEIEGNGIDDDENGLVDDVYGYDFYNDDNDPFDDNGHGTHVAGIIGAATNNETGVAGLAWQTRILPIKFSGSDGTGSSSAALSAIEYAVDMGAMVLNLSWGGTAYSEALFQTISGAEKTGVLFVTSAGNSATDNDLVPHYPSSYELPNIISVAASNENDLAADFSNWGITSVDLCAPGKTILSTLPDNYYGYMSGSSMAAPFVTGSIALVYSQFPEMSYLEVKQQLLATVDYKETFIGKNLTAGRLNTFNALSKQTYQNQLAITPGYLEFETTLSGETSEPQIIYFENISNNEITISNILAPDGFLFLIRDDYTNSAPSIIVKQGEYDSLEIVFAPAQASMHQQFLGITYQATALPVFYQNVQLAGRGVSGTMVLGGEVSGNWLKSQAPYYIKGDINIASNKSLIIEPGVHIEFLGHYSFTGGANSKLTAIGTFADSISFLPFDKAEGWNGLRFLDSSSDDRLDFCTIRYARKTGKSELLQDQFGGAIYCENSSPQIKNCNISNNLAVSGGAIYLLSSPVLIKNVSITENRATTSGGGIYCSNSDPELQNVIIAKNRSLNWLVDGDNGGGIFCRSSSPHLLNVTMVDNIADKGGGIYISQKSSHPTIVNSIFWSNIPDQVGFSNDPKQKSVTVAYSNLEDGQAAIENFINSTVNWLSGNLTQNPQFFNQETKNYYLLEESPCIDTGIENALISYNDGADQLSVPKLDFWGSGPDMGALEWNGTVPVELTSFIAKVLKERVVLSWVTENEINNLGFEIQKSFNAKDFIKIGFVPGDGTTTIKKFYSFVDEKIAGGNVAYRLIQIDQDGSRSVISSLNVLIPILQEFRMSQNYPNPFNATTMFDFYLPNRSKIKLSVYNLLGQNIKTIFSGTLKSDTYKFYWDGTNNNNEPVPSGVFLLKIEAADWNDSKKMIVLR
jgi:predicted outer membrane repeat protein